MLLSHLCQGDCEGRAPERLDQSGMLRIEVAHLINDARVVLFGLAGDDLNLLRRQL